MLEVYIDGCCEPNPGGTASYGFVVYKDGVRDYARAAIVGSGDKTSNNVAEYAGLVAFLEWFDNQPVEDVVIKSDSQLLVKQMSGEWRIKRGLYLPYAQRALAIMLNNAEVWKGKIKFKLIPREENKEADVLAHNVICLKDFEV